MSKCECGKFYKSELRSFYKGKCLCDECSKKMSKYERIIKSFLEENNIDFTQEFIINSCRDLYPLPFDFYLIKYNAFIEVDGQQHKKPVAFDGDIERANIKFELEKT